MKPFNVLRNIFKPQNNHNFVGAPSFSQVNPYDFFRNKYEGNDYASVYPNVRAISNEYMGIVPHAVDGNGKPVPHNVINALGHPNQLDSSVSFAEKMAVSTLVLPMTRLLVWRREGGEAKPGGDFYGRRGDNIAGFTYLENYSIDTREGKRYYRIGAQEFSDDEVVTLPGGVNPHSLYEGYSPTVAARRWATLDDLIAEFQNGAFANGGVPAGLLTITAAGKQDYEDTVKTIKEKHEGAGNNNKLIFAPRPMGADGKAGEAKIEWTPFAQTNKELEFGTIFEQVNNRLSLAYGVPDIIKGIDHSATYANAQVAEKTFAQRAVYPLALRNYTQLTHELNRITGGMGVAISFTYEIPSVADEEKVVADTKKVEGDIILTYTSDPYNWSLDSVVDAFNLSPRYKLLNKTTATPVIDNDQIDVDDGGEVDSSPDPSKIDGVTPTNKGEANRTNPKAELSDEQQMEAAAKKLLKAQVNRAIDELPEDSVENRVRMEVEPTQEEVDTFVDEMMDVVTALLIAYGIEEFTKGLKDGNLEILPEQGFQLTDEAVDSYTIYLRRVAESYSNDTAEAIRKVLAESNEFGYTRRETEKALADVIGTSDYRAKRLARTELNHSQNIGKLEGMKQLASQTGTTWEKTISHAGKSGICPLCASREGIWTAIDEPLWAFGETIEADDEDGNLVIYKNDWMSLEAQDYHANGTGALVFRRTQ